MHAEPFCVTLLNIISQIDRKSVDPFVWCVYNDQREYKKSNAYALLFEIKTILFILLSQRLFLGHVHYQYSRVLERPRRKSKFCQLLA